MPIVKKAAYNITLEYCLGTGVSVGRPQSDNTGAVVGGVVVTLVVVAVIAVTVVMVTYLVLRYKRGGKM